MGGEGPQHGLDCETALDPLVSPVLDKMIIIGFPQCLYGKFHQQYTTLHLDLDHSWGKGSIVLLGCSAERITIQLPAITLGKSAYMYTAMW